MDCPPGVNRRYKSDAPIPNGLGYSAVYEEVGTIMEGTDGNNWIVEEAGKTQRWKKIVKPIPILSEDRSSKSKSKSRTNRSTSRKPISIPNIWSFCNGLASPDFYILLRYK